MPVFDKITGNDKEPLPMILLASLFVYGILGMLPSFFPSFSLFHVYLSTSFSIIGVIARIWLNQKPNLWAKFISFFSMSILLTIIATRFLGYLFPKLSGLIGVVIVSSVLIAYIFPVLDPSKTKVLREELSYSPKTLVGRAILKYSLALLPIVGFIGASIGIYSGRYGNTKYLIFIIFAGSLSWFLALMFPYSTQYPMSPWEHQNRKSETNSN